MAWGVGRRVFTFAGDSVGEDNSAFTGRVFDVLDADGDACANDLFHGEGVDNL